MEESSIKMARYFGAILENRDYITTRHSRNVSRIAKIITDKLIDVFPECGLNEEDSEMISSAASLHDIGKLALPDSLIHKPVRMTEDEYEIFKSHTYKGKKMFEDILRVLEKDDPDRRFFEYCRDVSMYHHERYGGDGYPERRKKDDIPIAAQIVGLADAYDDLVSDRIYKKSVPRLEAYEMIMDGESGVFSPRLLQVFSTVRMELEQAIEEEAQR